MTKAQENTKRDQIEYEPQLSLVNSSTYSDSQQQVITKYQYPVVTHQCNHLRTCYDLEKVRADLNNPNLLSFTCPAQGCGAKITSEEELIKDIRWYANEEFHESIEECMVIEGRFFHRYYRARKYTDILNDKQIRMNIISMMNIFIEQYSINQLIIANLKISQINFFYAIRLLDKVKLTIPVRIQGCIHNECYEFTSLLAFQRENSMKMKFDCMAQGCNQKLEIQSVEIMCKQLIVDLHLLVVLKQCPPSASKFILNQTSTKIEAEVQKQNGFNIEPYVQRQITCHSRFKIIYNFKNKLKNKLLRYCNKM